ncbi:MAG: hypothetical protein QGI86_05550 [Candidatus Poribacteria bacterium]|nr:hypothetical protein [Candidatus Poribacteria bacterium]
MMILTRSFTTIRFPVLKTQVIGREAQGKIKPASILTEISVLTKLLTEKDRNDEEGLHENRFFITS